MKSLTARGALNLRWTRVVIIVGVLFATGIAVVSYRGPWSLSIFLPLAASIYNGFVPLKLTAVGGGKLQTESALRSLTVDLRGGFTLEELRLGKEVLRLRVDGRALRLGRFGPIDDVDHWLKEAQVAV